MILTLSIAAAILSLCAALRWSLDRPERKKRLYLGGRVQLTALWNDRAAFSLPIRRKLLMGTSVLALLAALFHHRASPAGAGLVLGGGLSNLLERLRGGRVYDYVRLPKAPWKLKKYVYNLADFALFFGLLAMVLRLGHRKNN